MRFAELRRLLWLSPNEQCVALRLATAYAGMMMFRYFVTSQSLAPILGHNAVIVEGGSMFPALLPALLMAVFFVIVRSDVRSSEPFSEPHRRQVVPALLVLAATFIVAAVALHPSEENFAALYRFMNEDLTIRVPLVASGIELMSAIPLLPLTFCLFPLPFLRRYRGLLLFGFLLFTAYLLGDVANNHYFQTTGPLLTGLVQRAVSFLPGGSFIHHSRWHATYREFTVIIGPACSDFTALVLLISMLGFVWWRRPPRGIARIACASLAVVAGTCGLFALNVIRITLIMAVGSVSPSLGMDLFHSSIGGILMFAYIAAFITLAARIGSSVDLSRDVTTPDQSPKSAKGRWNSLP